MYRSWLNSVRILALVSSLAILVSWYVLILGDLRSVGTDWTALLWPVAVPLWLPHLYVFWGAKESLAELAVKKTLAIALSWGSVVLLLSGLTLALTWSESSRAPVSLAAILALFQLLLVGSAIKTYYSMKKDPADRRILLTRLMVVVLAVVIAAVLIPFLFTSKRFPDEATAIGAVRTINVAQESYESDHPSAGYAKTLADLGTAPGAQLIDAVLARGEKSGYIFTLAPGPVDAQGRVTSYVVTARPKKYGKSTTRSFFSDQTGVIRSTTENRIPTAQDPPL